MVLQHNLGIYSLLFIHHILGKLNFILRLALRALKTHQCRPSRNRLETPPVPYYCVACCRACIHSELVLYPAYAREIKEFCRYQTDLSYNCTRIFFVPVEFGARELCRFSTLRPLSSPVCS